MSDLDPAAMTSRDLEILSLLTWGHTNREVADQLSVSLTTATTYIRFAYRKAGVTRRTQAVVWGFKHGLATSDWANTSRGTTASVPRGDQAVVGVPRGAPSCSWPTPP